MDDPKLLPKQAAKQIGVKTETLATWRFLKSKPLKYLRVGGRIFYLQSHIDEFLAGCVRSGLPEAKPKKRAAK